MLKVTRPSSRGVEVNLGRRDVVDDIKCDGICPRSKENKHVIEMNAQRQDQGLGGAEGDRVELRGVEVDADHQDV